MDPVINERFLFEELLSNTSDYIYFKDTESRFMRVSKQLAIRLGAESVKELIGKTDFDFFLEEHASAAFKDEQQIMRTGEPIIGIEEKETFPDGRVLWSSTSKFPLISKEGKIIGTVGISRDITEQKKAEQELKEREKQIQESLKEKELLLAEVHHRVKNNLAVISGIMELQRYNLDEENDHLIETLTSTQNRIQSIASVHELLYKTENFANIEVTNLLKKMVVDTQGSYNSSKLSVSFDLEIDEVILSPNQAVPFCMLINELVQNSYKHAFKNKSSGTIFVKVKSPDKKEVRVIYFDDGTGNGKTNTNEENKADSLGLTLIKALTEQLNARTEKLKQYGTYSYSFVFRVEKDKGVLDWEKKKKWSGKFQNEE